jgi:peptidoglycan/xylan/chitin deacetylase (PgdA/CDA1 family)
MFANRKASKNKNISSRVFIYHNVASSQVDAFRNQIKLLKENFDEIVNASDFVKLSQQNMLNSKKYACITFDDGFDDVYDNAKPILDEFQVTATIFLNQTLYDLTNSNPEHLQDFINEKFPRLSESHTNLKGLSEKQLRQFISDNYEIGGHTYSHISVPKTTKESFESEITKQRQFLIANFNYEIKSFAYPYGRKKDIPNWGAQSLKKSGYDSGFSGISHDLRKLDHINPYEFPRTSVSLDINEKEFINLIKGSSDILDKLTGQYK